MEFEEMILGIADETVRANVKTAYQAVNQQKGEFGRKLIEKDTELAGLKTEKQTYGKAHDAMTKSGIAPEQIPKLLEKLGYQKTMEEEYEITKVVLTETKKQQAELAKENSRLKAEKAMGKVFDKLRTEFKDDQGQPIKLSDNFINLDKLYDVQDFSNETVLQEKCKLVLSEAFTAQTKVLRDVGFLGVSTHTTPDGKQVTNPQVLDIAKVMKEQGAAAAIEAMHHNQAQKAR